MLLSLNDDCLFHICKYLNFAEQAFLAHVCQRLQAVVEVYWAHNHKVVKLDRKQCWLFEKHKTYFVEFMNSISKNVEVLQLESCESPVFCSFQNICFPKAVSFSVNFHYNRECNDDEDTKQIVKLFPGLRKLSLACSTTTGKYLWNLENLIELELGGCEDLQTKHFKKIFSTLRLKKLDIMYHGYNTCFDELGADIAECETLEELRIDDHHMLLLVGKLAKLKKLRKLVVYTRDYDKYLLKELVQRNGATMETMIFDDVFWSDDEHCESVKQMLNLRELILHEDNIEVDQLESIGKILGNTLEEFRFVKMQRSKQIDDGILAFLASCKNLDIFDISNNDYDVVFLRKIISTLTIHSKNRKKPLLVRCSDTKISAEDAELLTIPNCVEIVVTKDNFEFPGTRCFQCEWKNSDEKTES